MTIPSSTKCFALAMLLFSHPALAIDVTFCGQEVPPGETGVLTTDIDCSAVDDVVAGVLLGNQATLYLNGHTITGRTGASLPRIVGVVSNVARRMAIVGPGVITGSSTGIAAAKTKVTVTDVTLRDNEYSIDVSTGTLTLSNVDASSTRSGINGRNIKATNLTVTTSYSGDCILGRNMTGSDVTVTGCWSGVSMTGAVKLTRLDARNNQTIGVAGKRVTLVDSVVTGNIFIGHPLDILSAKLPRLQNTPCGTSARIENDQIGATWGVCAND